MSPLTKANKNAYLVFSAFGNIVDKDRQRLIDMGLVPGESIRILQQAHGCVTLMLKGSKIALDHKTAGEIIVREANQ